MTSLRIDGNKSAKVWAKRLDKFLKAAEEDGVQPLVNDVLGEIGLAKDGKAFTSMVQDITEEVYGEAE